MDRACEAPRFGEELSDSCRFHLSEVLTTMDWPEMGQVTCRIELIGNDGETGGLLHINLTSGDKITSRQKVLKFLTNLSLRIYKFLKVVRVPDSHNIKFGVLQVLY